MRGVRQQDRVQCGVLEPEGAAEQVCDLVVLPHRRLVEHARTETHAPQRHGDAVARRRIDEQLIERPGQIADRVEALLLQRRADRSGRESADRVREGVEQARHREPPRKRGEDCRIVHHEIGARPIVASGLLRPAVGDPEDARHLRAGPRGRDGDELHVGLHPQRLPETGGGAAADREHRVRVKVPRDGQRFVDDRARHVDGGAVEHANHPVAEIELIDEPPGRGRDHQHPARAAGVELRRESGEGLQDPDGHAAPLTPPPW